MWGGPVPKEITIFGQNAFCKYWLGGKMSHKNFLIIVKFHRRWLKDRANAQGTHFLKSGVCHFRPFLVLPLFSRFIFSLSGFQISSASPHRTWSCRLWSSTHCGLTPIEKYDGGVGECKSIVNIVINDNSPGEGATLYPASIYQWLQVINCPPF